MSPSSIAETRMSPRGLVKRGVVLTRLHHPVNDWPVLRLPARSDLAVSGCVLIAARCGHDSPTREVNRSITRSRSYHSGNSDGRVRSTGDGTTLVIAFRADSSRCGAVRRRPLVHASR